MKIPVALVVVLLLTASAAAQQAPEVRPAVPAAPAPPAPPPPPPPPAPPAPPPDSINVRYEIALRDTGGAQPGTKTVTMTATGGATSSVRATGTTAGRGVNPLNVDVMPSGIRDGRVHTYIGLEYVPQSPGAAGPPPLSVRQTLHVWLDSGKPMIVSQATDPNSDRRLEVTVTATILK